MRGLVFAFLAEIGFRRLIVREFPLTSPVDAIRAKIQVDITALNAGEIDEYNQFRRPVNLAWTRDRVNNGDVCFVARHNGQIIGACWIATGKAWSAYLRAPVQLAVDEAYGYDLYTSSEWRGNGLPAAITSEMHRWCRAHGFTRVIGFTIPENRPAMTNSIGYRSIGVIGYVGFRKFRRPFCRMNPGERAPGQVANARPDWDASVNAVETKGHYLDDFLAHVKREAYLDLVAEWGGLPSGGRVLKTDLFEEAIGPDAFLLDLPASSSQMIGMDISGVAASRARKRDAASRAAYITADTRALPFADGSIDVVISPSTLDHFHDDEDLDESQRELRRVLAQEGRLIITLDNRQNIFDPLLRLVNRVGAVPYFLGRSYSVDELRRRLERAGFEVRDTTAIVHHPRLTGVAATGIVNRIGWNPLKQAVHRAFLRMQKLKDTRWQYFSGCFVAALAVPRADASSANGSARSDELEDRVA
jgi:SAM-dependent methyltransferase/GNAT superfamily N-acetyltransferase